MSSLTLFRAPSCRSSALQQLLSVVIGKVLIMSAVPKEQEVLWTGIHFAISKEDKEVGGFASDTFPPVRVPRDPDSVNFYVEVDLDAHWPSEMKIFVCGKSVKLRRAECEVKFKTSDDGDSWERLASTADLFLELGTFPYSLPLSLPSGSVPAPWRISLEVEYELLQPENPNPPVASHVEFLQFWERNLKEII